MPTLPDNCVDLIIDSPPYADQRKDTYGGIHPDKYVEWFLPIAAELKRVLKPEGSFILNIKEEFALNGLKSVKKLDGAFQPALFPFNEDDSLNSPENEEANQKVMLILIT